MYSDRAIEAERVRIITIRNNYEALMEKYLKLKYKRGIEVYEDWLFRWENEQDSTPYEGLNVLAWQNLYRDLLGEYERLKENK